ncbi:MAG: hypothetical protein ACRESZ_04535, partial [Methylococcales bacterium]
WGIACRNLSEDWIDAFAKACQKPLNWFEHASGWLRKKFYKIGAQDTNEIILVSVLPHVVLAKLWREAHSSGHLQKLTETMSENLKWSLDCHAPHPGIRSVLEPHFSLEEVLLIGESGSAIVPLMLLREAGPRQQAYHNYLAAESLAALVVRGPNRAWDSVQVRFRARARARAWAQDRALDWAQDWARARARDLARARAGALDPALALDLDLDLDRVLDRAQAQAQARYFALDPAGALDRAQALSLALALNQYQALDHALTLALTMALALDWALDRALARALDRLRDPGINHAQNRRIIQWMIVYVCAKITPIVFTSPAQACKQLEGFAENQPEFKALFDREWFPYEDLKKIAKEPFQPAPIEALSHRLYFELKKFLREIHADISDLPESLALEPGEAIRKWHGDEIADQYLEDLKSAGWDPATEPWPPKNPY